MSLVIDADALAALRAVLVDENPAAYTYTDARLVLALRDNRQTVLFRDPGYAASGVNPYLWYRGKVHVPETDPDHSLLISEQDKRNFQAPRFYRHWDSLGQVTVWRNGVKKTLTTDYTLDYAQGRVTFTTDVDDWEAVNASYSYYRIYHAARDILLGSLASNANNLVSVRLGNDSFTTAPVREQIAAINGLILNQTDRNVRFVRRMY